MSFKPVCQYYLRGICKFGDGCRNSHPAGQEGSQARPGDRPVVAQAGPAGPGKAPVIFK
ncbi:hypothetical protein BOTBODRAFT_293246 [Botryobasidium botryosum FD-172 SS1]|uniref:C3H1-type domain-containing protein n=1 Tax=Botryobasidium botryosum (strain FD-172 SS1) TaxID=930990 RepID=A0A067MI89_BOTB1|nr:hypothetical protein BOTBODRAFT_293246 [Botryobasidium botryosum FD-172 SS1]